MVVQTFDLIKYDKFRIHAHDFHMLIIFDNRKKMPLIKLFGLIPVDGLFGYLRYVVKWSLASLLKTL